MVVKWLKKNKFYRKVQNMRLNNTVSILLASFLILCMANTVHGKKKETESPSSQESYQVSRQQVDEVLLHLEKCAQKSVAPENMFFCACESDIFLSRLPAPADPTAHCKDVAQYNLQVTKLTKQKQMDTPMRTGAKDIGVGSLNFFGFFAPCIIRANKEGDPKKIELCHCLTHGIVNKLVFKKITTSELIDEFKKTAEKIKDHSDKCWQ